MSNYLGKKPSGKKYKPWTNICSHCGAALAAEDLVQDFDNPLCASCALTEIDEVGYLDVEEEDSNSESLQQLLQDSLYQPGNPGIPPIHVQAMTLLARLREMFGIDVADGMASHVFEILELQYANFTTCNECGRTILLGTVCYACECDGGALHTPPPKAPLKAPLTQFPPGTHRQLEEIEARLDALEAAMEVQQLPATPGRHGRFGEI